MRLEVKLQRVKKRGEEMEAPIVDSLQKKKVQRRN